MKKLLLALGTVAAVVAPVASVVACGSSTTKAKAVETKSSVLDQVKATAAYKALSDTEKAKYDSMTLEQLQAALKELQAKDVDAGSATTDGEGAPVETSDDLAVAQAGKLSADDLEALGLDELTLDANQELIDTYEAYLDIKGKTSAELAEASQATVASLAQTQAGQEAIANLVGQDLFAITDLGLEDALKEFDTQFSAVSNTDGIYTAPATAPTAPIAPTTATKAAAAAALAEMQKATPAAVDQAGKLSADDLTALGLDAATLKTVTDKFDAA